MAQSDCRSILYPLVLCSERLSKERDKVADVIRVEFAENLATSEALVESLRRELREVMDLGTCSCDWSFQKTQNVH